MQLDRVGGPWLFTRTTIESCCGHWSSGQCRTIEPHSLSPHERRDVHMMGLTCYYQPFWLILDFLTEKVKEKNVAVVTGAHGNPCRLQPRVSSLNSSLLSPPRLGYTIINPPMNAVSAIVVTLQSLVQYFTKLYHHHGSWM